MKHPAPETPKLDRTWFEYFIGYKSVRVQSAEPNTPSKGEVHTIYFGGQIFVHLHCSGPPFLARGGGAWCNLPRGTKGKWAKNKAKKLFGAYGAYESYLHGTAQNGTFHNPWGARF